MVTMETSNDIVQVIILDISGMYARIHDQVYCSHEKAGKFSERYSDKGHWHVLVLEFMQTQGLYNRCCCMQQHLLQQKRKDGANIASVKGEMIMQRKQMVQHAVVTKNGIIEKVGKSIIYQPKTNFKGGEIKWYEDKKKSN